MIGVFAALPAEAACLAGRRCAAGVLVQPVPGLALVAGGIGADAAARGAEQLLTAGATALCSWGCAAGLAPALQAGDVLIPAVIIGSSGERFTADPAWRSRLLARLASMRVPAREESLTHSPAVLQSAADKAKLYRATGAAGADMESAGVAAIAARHGVPFLCIRAVADTASMSIPPQLLAVIDDYGRPRLPGLLLAMVRKPGLIRDLLRMGRAFRAATRSLKTIARETGGLPGWHKPPVNQQD